MLRRARAAGVAAMLAVSTSLADSRRTARLRGAGVLKAVGIHPLDSGPWDVAALKPLLAAPGVTAIGECGFDNAGPPWDEQAELFRAQCDLAREAGLPLILHVDGATAFKRLSAAERALDGLTVVRHYFRGDAAEADWHAQRGHFVSFGRPLLRCDELAAIAEGYAPELLLIETDSYPLPGRTTEPASLPEVGAALAAALGVTLAACADLLWANAARVFPAVEGAVQASPRGPTIAGGGRR